MFDNTSQINCWNWLVNKVHDWTYVLFTGIPHNRMTERRKCTISSPESSFKIWKLVWQIIQSFKRLKSLFGLKISVIRTFCEENKARIFSLWSVWSLFPFWGITCLQLEVFIWFWLVPMDNQYLLWVSERAVYFFARGITNQTPSFVSHEFGNLFPQGLKEEEEEFMSSDN